MGRKSNKEKLFILIDGQTVGELEKSPQGVLKFSYVSSWLENEKSYPLSQSLPLNSQSYKGEVVENYFDNLLPDQMALRKLLAQKVRAKTTQPFDLLSIIGRDCVGALQISSHDHLATQKKLTFKEVSASQISNILQKLDRIPLGIDIDEDFRISLAGAQEKTAFLKIGPNKWAIPQGQTPATHIFKIPMSTTQTGVDMTSSVENEWLCLQICRAFGLPTAVAEIKYFNKEKALVVERFDRIHTKKPIQRLHVEDMCQALGYPSHLKYQSDGGPDAKSILNLLNASQNPKEDRFTFMKSLVVFWLLGAIDGHAKNFSIFTSDKGIQLTPLYDVLSAFPAVNKKQLFYEKLKLSMKISKYYHVSKIFRRHFLDFAKEVKFSSKEMDKILLEVQKTAIQIPGQIEPQLPEGFPDFIFQSITNGMLKNAKRLE